MRYRLASMKDVHERFGSNVVVNGNDIAVFFRERKYFAALNNCPHQHFSVLHQGKLEGCTIECPMHGWTFDLHTGNSTNGNGKLRMFPVTVVGNDLFIEIED